MCVCGVCVDTFRIAAFSKRLPKFRSQRSDLGIVLLTALVFFLLHIWGVCLHVFLYNAPGNHKRSLDPLELELLTGGCESS